MILSLFARTFCGFSLLPNTSDAGSGRNVPFLDRDADPGRPHDGSAVLLPTRGKPLIGPKPGGRAVYTTICAGLMAGRGTIFDLTRAPNHRANALAGKLFVYVRGLSAFRPAYLSLIPITDRWAASVPEDLGERRATFTAPPAVKLSAISHTPGWHGAYSVSAGLCFRAGHGPDGMGRGSLRPYSGDGCFYRTRTRFTDRTKTRLAFHSPDVSAGIAC